jgi:hypothetical protein
MFTYSQKPKKTYMKYISPNDNSNILQKIDISYNIKPHHDLSGTIKPQYYDISCVITDISSIWISFDMDVSNGKIDISYSGIDISFVNTIIEEITEYANKIYSDVYGIEGICINTNEDYTKLFLLASKIAKQAKEAVISIDYSIFGDFSNVAENLHDIFQDYIVQLKNPNCLHDIKFLQSISNSLKKIWNIKETFRKFKEAIISLSLDNIIHNRIDLSMDEIEIIEETIEKIQNWDKLYTTGMKIEISNKPYSFIEQANKIINSTSEIIEDAVSVFKDKDKNPKSNKKK